MAPVALECALDSCDLGEGGTRYKTPVFEMEEHAMRYLEMHMRNHECPGRQQQQDKDEQLSVLPNQIKCLESRINKRLTEKDHEIDFLKDKLDEYKHNSQCAFLDIQNKLSENYRDLENISIGNNIMITEALICASNTLDTMFKNIENNKSRINEEINSKPKLVENILTLCQDQIKDINSSLEKAKKQFQTKMDMIKENAMKSDKCFEENFSSLSHATEDKKEAAPGRKIIKDKDCKVLKIQRHTTTYSLPFVEEIPVFKTYRNDQGVYEQVARILFIKDVNTSVSKVKSFPSKTILLVGVTGAGKSTLIDGIANFLYNVRYEDNHRLQLISLMGKEEAKVTNQAVSQTEDITVYKIPYLRDGNVPFCLNIIDTPGVGDTRGMQQDQALLKKLETLFSPDCGHVPRINAVCFVSHAGNARLTPGQRYIFDKIITNFGIDIKDNIFGLFTFDDGTTPKGLAAFEEAGIGLCANFQFNSLGMLSERRQSGVVDKNIMMSPDATACIQFQNFYDNCNGFMACLEGMKPVSTEKTVKVMQNRSKIETQMYTLQNKLHILLEEKETVRVERQIFEKFKADEVANKDYEADVSVAGSETEYLNGTFVTNCGVCNTTCHDNCAYADDDDKASCSAMEPQGDKARAACTECPRKCHWTEHRNMPFRYKVTRKTERRTAEDIKKKYEEAIKNQGQQMTVIEKMEEKVTSISKEIQASINQIRECIDKLDSIALKTAATNSSAYIQQMIDTEKMNQEEGYQERIRHLEEEKVNAENLDKILHDEDLEGFRSKKGSKKEKKLNVVKATTSKHYNGYDKHEIEMKNKYKKEERKNKTEDTAYTDEWTAKKNDLVNSFRCQNIKYSSDLDGNEFSSFNEKIKEISKHLTTKSKAACTENNTMFHSSFEKSEKQEAFARSYQKYDVQSKEEEGETTNDSIKANDSCQPDCNERKFVDFTILEEKTQDINHKASGVNDDGSRKEGYDIDEDYEQDDSDNDYENNMEYTVDKEICSGTPCLEIFGLCLREISNRSTMSIRELEKLFPFDEVTESEKKYILISLAQFCDGMEEQIDSTDILKHVIKNADDPRTAERLLFFYLKSSYEKEDYEEMKLAYQQNNLTLDSIWEII